MAIFKSYDSKKGKRAAEDVQRHKELIEKSIKENIKDIIADESIIGQNKDKKVRIPVKSLKEYRFIHGSNKGNVTSGTGEEKRGDHGSQENKKGEQGKAGEEEGDEVYETEITMEELIQYLLEDLKLPDLDKKKIADIEELCNSRRLGYKRKGIAPQLAKKKSVIEKIKRVQGVRKTYIEEGKEDEIPERIPFMEQDLRYHRVKEDTEKRYNAVIICIMDVSGSMDASKKYLARSFYFLLYQFLKLNYSNIQIVFVAHTTIAKEVNETDFFSRMESGGTFISSGYEKAIEIIKERYNPEIWNTYAFHCTDSDNWANDNAKAKEATKTLLGLCNLFGYVEIIPTEENYWNIGGNNTDSFKTELKKSFGNEDNFVSVSITKKEDVVPAVKNVLEKNSDKSKED
jgi:sporulation protein YhbH